MNPDTDTDNDGLAAETRRLLDAATKGDWDQVGATVEKEEDVGWCIVVAECDKVADAALIAAAPRLLANWLAREDKHADATVLDVLADWWFAADYCNQPEPFKVRVSESIVDALQEGGYEVVPIAERDRLADENRALRDERDRYRQHSVLLNRVSWKLLQATGRVGDGDDKYEHESEELCLEMVAELVEKVDAAQLQSIEARNPGIDMEEVRRVRLAYPDHERHETVSRAKYGASLASDIAADGGAAVAEGAEDRGQTDG